jgi:hypothetical protein
MTTRKWFGRRATVYELGMESHRWGDYGNVLYHGQGRRGEDGLIELSRTGPFVPPLTFPYSYIPVVTTAFRAALEQSGLSGVDFQPVRKKHIVRYQWHLWDQKARNPQQYPANGEPEEYISERHHDEETARALGDLWELHPPAHAEVSQSPRDHLMYLVEATKGSSDFFRASFNGKPQNAIYVTEAAKKWLMKHAGEVVKFEKARIEP